MNRCQENNKNSYCYCSVDNKFTYRAYNPTEGRYLCCDHPPFTQILDEDENAVNFRTETTYAYLQALAPSWPECSGFMGEMLEEADTYATTEITRDQYLKDNFPDLYNELYMQKQLNHLITPLELSNNNRTVASQTDLPPMIIRWQDKLNDMWYENRISGIAVEDLPTDFPVKLHYFKSADETDCITLECDLGLHYTNPYVRGSFVDQNNAKGVTRWYHLWWVWIIIVFSVIILGVFLYFAFHLQVKKRRQELGLDKTATVTKVVNYKNELEEWQRDGLLPSTSAVNRG